MVDRAAGWGWGRRKGGGSMCHGEGHIAHSFEWAACEAHVRSVWGCVPQMTSKTTGVVRGSTLE